MDWSELEIRGKVVVAIISREVILCTVRPFTPIAPELLGRAVGSAVINGAAVSSEECHSMHRMDGASEASK